MARRREGETVRGYRVTRHELDEIHAAFKAGAFVRALALISGLRDRMYPDGWVPLPDWKPPEGVLRGVVKEFLNYIQTRSEDGLGRSTKTETGTES